MAMNEAKLSVLMYYWSKKVFELKKRKQKEMQKIANSIISFDKELLEQFLKLYMRKCQTRHEIAFFQWRDMFEPRAKKDELREAFENRVKTAKKMNPKLCQMVTNMETKGANLSALNQAKTVNKMGKDLSTRMNKLTAKKRSTSKVKLTSSSSFQAHLINHLAEIGWLHPFKSEPVEDTKGMIHAQFDVLAYDACKYV